MKRCCLSCKFCVVTCLPHPFLLFLGFFHMYLRRKEHLPLTCGSSLGLCTLPGLVKHAHRLQCLLLKHMLWTFSQLAAERMMRTVTSIGLNCRISYLVCLVPFFMHLQTIILPCAPSGTVLLGVMLKKKKQQLEIS